MQYYVVLAHHVELYNKIFIKVEEDKKNYKNVKEQRKQIMQDNKDVVEKISTISQEVEQSDVKIKKAQEEFNELEKHDMKITDEKKHAIKD